MLGVLWFQSPKMAYNAFTAAEYTVQHYSHVCSILQHLEKKLPNLQILGLESPSHSYNWKNELQYVYILKVIHVGCIISLMRTYVRSPGKWLRNNCWRQRWKAIQVQKEQASWLGYSWCSIKFPFVSFPKFQSVGYLVEVSQSVSAQDKISNITIGYPTWARL